MRKAAQVGLFLALIASGLYMSYLNLVWSFQFWNQDEATDDFVTDWEGRLSRLESDLPVDAQVVGYIADWDIPGSYWDGIDQSTEYVLTQYTFAPRVIQRGFDHTWIIGNFISPNFRAWLDQKLTDYELKQYGRGIYLIQRLDQ